MNSSTQASGDVTRHSRFESDSSTIATARAYTAEWAQEAGASQRQVDQLMLIVSELTSNAVEASPTSYELALRSTDEFWRVAVSNPAEAGAVPDQGHWAPEDVLAERGRGLSIVDALASEVTVREGGGAVTITATVRR